jgi:peptidoglycan/LPS O-acetylase OafA/YrhL
MHTVRMTSTGHADAWRLGRRPALDGLRGVAILLVLVGHGGTPLFVNSAAVGVNLFFTLSGFLITCLLLEERARDGRVAFGSFYWRRGLRLLPALIALVAGVWILDLALGLGWVTPEASVAALFYSTNLWIYFGSSGALGHTWSLSLEEQFYLTWPLVLVVLFRLGRHRAVLTAAVVLGLTSMTQLFLTADDPLRSFAPDTRSFFLLFGCALAAAFTGATKVRVPGRAVGVTACIFLVLAAMASGDVAGALAIPATILGTLAAVWIAATRGAGELGLPLLRWLGQRSYGIYLWHYPVLVLALREGAPWPVRLALVSGVSVALAMVSWRYVETPFLRLKHRHIDRAASHANKPGSP